MVTAMKTKKKAGKSFTTKFTVAQSPMEVFDAITNVKGWWSSDITGKSTKKGDVFRFRYPEMHDSTQKLTEVVPGKKVVWLVTKAKLSFTKDQKEWEGNRIQFDIAKKGKKTEVKFTQFGLTPEVECYKACSKGWGYYFGESLKDLITKGEGKPE